MLTSLLLFRPSSGLGFPGGSDGKKKKKNLPAKWETWDHSLGQEDSLEKGMATHSTILAWAFPWTGKPGGLLLGAVWEVLPVTRS